MNREILNISGVIGLSPLQWRNWQTPGTYNPVGSDTRTGSIPVCGMIISERNAVKSTFLSLKIMPQTGIEPVRVSLPTGF